MGRNKTNTALVTAAAGRSVKERHQRAARDNVTVPRHLVAVPEKNIKSKHQSYFQFFENKDRKDKKLEFQVTTDPNPPPGFEFVPSGNPELTKACKELSREQDAMIFIVSAAKDAHNHEEDDVKKLALQVHRMGHHIRRTIVEQAKIQVGRDVVSASTDNWQLPDTQEEINRQAEAAIRDLFPRIPNFDKQMIIQHSFRKGKDYGKPKVGTSDLPLHRRVQLAVLAHIRHTHTRYDNLLKEADWHTARKAVERTCLDILVKWRGDEETGRDQLDDILREVVVISDDSDDSNDDEEESSDEDSVHEVMEDGSVSTIPAPGTSTHQMHQPGKKFSRKPKAISNRISKQARADLAHSKKQQDPKRNKRGFKRYEAVQRRWEEAVNRNRHAQTEGTASYAPVDRVPSQSLAQRPSVEIISPVHRIDERWDNRAHPASQPPHGQGQVYGHRPRPDEVPVAQHQTDERHMPLPNRSHSGFAPPEGVVIGRRIARLPTESRHAPVPERLYHGELKDFLVPSIEPISPHSRPDAQQSARRVIREEPFHLEQVPTGQAGAPGRQFVHLDVRHMTSEFQLHHPPVDQGVRSAVVPASRERFASRHEPHYEREPRPHSTVGVPPEVGRVYRVRESVEDHRDGHGVPMNATTRVIRVRGEARPTEFWEPEPARMRELSPRRLGPYSRASPSAAYGGTEHRRVVYREASASGVDAYRQGPPTNPARPLYYEVRSAAQTGSWQGSSLVRPGLFSHAQPQGPEGPRDVVVRHPVQESIPVHRIPAEYPQRGCSHHERTPSGHLTRAAAPANSGSVEYLYEKQAPSRDIIVLR